MLGVDHDPEPEIRYFASLGQASAARQKIWDDKSQLTLLYRANELAGEAGEMCNVVKKLERERLGLRGSRATLEDLADELADVVICADLLAKAANINLDEAVARKFNKTSEKYNLPIRLIVPEDRK